MFNTVVTPSSTLVQWSFCGAYNSSAVTDYANASSYHPGGVNSLMDDGHVQFVKDTINVLVWQGLGSRNGGEVISSDAY